MSSREHLSHAFPTQILTARGCMRPSNLPHERYRTEAAIGVTATKPLGNAAAPPLVDEALSRAPVGPASHVWGSQGARASTMDRRLQKYAGSIGIACAGWDCRADFARR